MSLRRPLINAYLRSFEKPRLARVEDPLRIRRSFEFQARWFFRSPRGTQRKWLELGQSAPIRALEVRPRKVTSEGVLFYIHGGAFLFGSPRTHAPMVSELCRLLSARAILPRYRLAPEHRFPAAFEDVRAAWEGLMAQGVPPEQVVIGGDSAGGALALGLLASLCAENRPRPAGAFCLSPLTDMTYSSESLTLNARAEALLAAERAGEIAAFYLGDHPRDDPRVSPVRADFPGAPPVFLTVGDTEILHGDSCRMADHLRAQGADVTLIERRDLPHVWPMLKDILPEGRETLAEIADWIRRQKGWPDES